MGQVDVFRKYGLFDARVPRYTSYPPANRFAAGTGQRHMPDWLDQITPGTPLSIYVHIPFCRRLCWFCACRTQGTSTLAPVDAYLDHVIREIEAVAARLPEGAEMSRLHLGGGTPTLLSPAQMSRLLDTLHQAFAPRSDFEFSVEIDPTEAAPELLRELGEWSISRASIGVQDFSPAIQAAIGREQSVTETRRVADDLRDLGVGSLNIDLLYGLPHQTGPSLLETLEEVALLTPERVALYGYAHVPHASKRQVLIDADALPGGEARFQLATEAAGFFRSLGYQALGIDHFAKPGDSLAQAAGIGRMRRNFQGYTDDPCDVLLGFGASAISQLPQGYSQNAVATGAYCARVDQSGTAPYRGYVLSDEDKLIARIIEMLMCRFSIDIAELDRDFPGLEANTATLIAGLETRFAPVLERDGTDVAIRPGLELLVRVIAGALDDQKPADFQYSKAV